MPTLSVIPEEVPAVKLLSPLYVAEMIQFPFADRESEQVAVGTPATAVRVFAAPQSTRVCAPNAALNVTLPDGTVAPVTLEATVAVNCTCSLTDELAKPATTFVVVPVCTTPSTTGFDVLAAKFWSLPSVAVMECGPTEAKVGWQVTDCANGTVHKVWLFEASTKVIEPVGNVPVMAGVKAAVSVTC